MEKKNDYVLTLIEVSSSVTLRIPKRYHLEVVEEYNYKWYTENYLFDEYFYDAQQLSESYSRFVPDFWEEFDNQEDVDDAFIEYIDSHSHVYICHYDEKEHRDHFSDEEYEEAIQKLNELNDAED